MCPRGRVGARAGSPLVVGVGMACAVTALPILILLMDKLEILRLPIGQRLLRYASLDDVMALAEAFGIDVVPHSACYGPGLLASIHCIAAMPNESPVERFDADFAENPLHGAINPGANGRIAVPQGPGLGIDPDPAIVAKLRVN